MITILEVCIFVVLVLLVLKFINKLTKGYDQKDNSLDPKSKLAEVEEALAHAKDTLTEAEIQVLEREREALRNLAENKVLRTDINNKKQKL